MRITKILRIQLIIVFCFPVAALAQVQNSNEIVVEISKEKTVIDGKVYYLHTVKKGENIYRISRAYGITQKDIVIANPEIISGIIKEGQVLKIPSELIGPRNIQQIESEKFIYHIVEEGQTIFQLTQQYKITKEELFKFNPELELSPLQVGQVVRIPKNVNASVEPNKVQIIENYVEHKVKRRETKYSISRDYNISVDELIAANPILNTEDLKTDQILRIPVKQKTEIVSLPIVHKPDTVSVINYKTSVPCNKYPPFSESYNIALLLPLNIEDNETLVKIDSFNANKEGEKQSIENNEIYLRTKNLVEFYQGVLLALDTLKRAGMYLKLYTYDTGRDTLKIARILSRPEMVKMDLIIGPFFTEAVEKAAQFALKHQIKLVSPVSVNSNVLKNNPYIFQVIPNDTVNADAMINYIASLPNKNIVLISNNKPEDKEITDLYRKKLSISFPNNFIEFNYRNEDSQLNLYMFDSINNIVIIPSEDINFIEIIFGLLNPVAKNFPIKVFGLPICTMFKDVRQDYFHNLEFHYYTSFFTDFNSSYIKNFLSKYKMYYNTEPYYHYKNNYPYYFTKEGFNFAFLGYDVAFYFLNSMGRLGKNFENCIGSQKFDLLHSNLNFERLNPGSGFLNKGVNILKYSKDYYITKVY